MKLEDLKSINQDVAKRLMKDGWTVEKLAQADVFVLEKYKGIGKAKARQIIDEAQELVTPKQEQEPTLTITDSEGNVEERPVSVKVKRIHERMNE